MKKLIKKLKFVYELELVTGLHIGDSKDNTDIGGVDNPVVRVYRNNSYQPYIPGSSLKGKLRSLLELATGTGVKGTTNNFDSDKYPLEYRYIPDLFGGSGENGNASRLLVRDAFLTTDSDSSLKESEFTDMPYTEVKHENVIDRIKGTAEHPRKFERVPAGAKFDVEFVINIFEGDDEKLLKDALEAAIELLEEDYLGGSGSRGYGKVKFKPKNGSPEKIDIEKIISEIK